MSVYQGGNPADKPMEQAGSRPAPWRRWQDWANLIVAIWLFITPWIVSGAGTTYAVQFHHAEWNAWIAGIIVALVALWALAQPEAPAAEWVNVVAGLWLFVAPWIVGYAATARAESWNQWVVGIIVFVLALWAGGDTQRRTTARA